MPHPRPSPRRRRPPALLVVATLVVVALLVLAGCRADPPSPPPGGVAATDLDTGGSEGGRGGPPARSPATEALEAALLADVATELEASPGDRGSITLHPGCTPLLLHVLSVPWAWAELAPGDRLAVEELRATWRAEAPPELQADLAAAHAIVEEVADELDVLRAAAPGAAADGGPPPDPMPSVTLGGHRAAATVDVAGATDAGLGRLEPVLARVDAWVQQRCTGG